ncbi:hypothetical protein BGZ58_007510 [Dissophora ornata]|nr:hypothetical protein BGZ58_007510 [Dissophora ornata]
MIGKVKVIKVPLQLHSLLPMAAGITEELKANYHVLLMEKWKSVVAQSVNIAIEDYLRLIPDAWSRVPESTFKRTFQKFIPDESGSCPSDEPNVTEPDQKQSMVTKLQVALRDVSPAIPESVLQYYLNQDNDTGPSGFLRAKILEMNLPEDSECCFDYIYHLTLMVVRVLDAMADNKVKGLDPEKLHAPPTAYLHALENKSNPQMVYQASYASQTLPYAPDDETPWLATVRRTGKVSKGVSGLVSAVKGLNLNRFMEGLSYIQEGLTGASRVITLAKNVSKDASTLAESIKEFVDCLKQGLSFSRK